MISPFLGDLSRKNFINKYKWSGRRDSNARHPAWKAGTLPTELHPHGVVARDGFEPSKGNPGRFTVCCLWPLGNLASKSGAGDRT